MKRSFSFRLLAAALLLTSASLAACSTGTDTADTNVETGTTKDFTEQSSTIANGNTTAGDSATAGLQADTSAVTGRDVYENANNRKDRNNDGLSDQ